MPKFPKVWDKVERIGLGPALSKISKVVKIYVENME